MFSRLLRLRSLANCQAYPRRFKSGWVDGGDHATHNDLPVPKGDWRVHYSRLNLRNNIVFVTGILALVGSIIMICYSGDVDFNAKAPKHWKEDESEEC